MNIPVTDRTLAAPWGVVMAIQANYYDVQIRDWGDGVSPDKPTLPSSLLCTRRARLKKIGQQIMVGDAVHLEAVDWEGGRGAIAAVLPRETVLDRPSIANADHILLVFALAEPELDPQQLSRFLVTAEAAGLRMSICLNKQDLVTVDTCQYWQDQLAQWGYTATAVSLRSEAVPRQLGDLLRDRTTVVSGPSGVGKSSLINQLIPQATLRTGAVSGKLGRGRHTTRHVELFELPGGGFLADTPGFNQPDLAQLAPTDLGQYFPEIRRRLAQQTCQFRDCLHQGEVGCAVGVDWLRYDIYRTLLKEAQTHQEHRQHRPDPDAALKVKMGNKGQQQHEPRLQVKRYRRLSRRSQRQLMDEWRYGPGDYKDQEDAIANEDSSSGDELKSSYDLE